MSKYRSKPERYFFTKNQFFSAFFGIFWNVFDRGWLCFLGRKLGAIKNRLFYAKSGFAFLTFFSTAYQYFFSNELLPFFSEIAGARLKTFFQPTRYESTPKKKRVRKIGGSSVSPR